MDRGLAAHARRDYTAASRQLSRAAEGAATDAAARRALLALAAVELDPRNPERAVHRGTRRLADYLALPTVSPWEQPVVETFYLLARSVGGRAPADWTSALPRLPGPPLSHRIRHLESQRDSLRRQLRELQRTLVRERRQMKALELELRRIRKLLEP